jgi:hypothetical protein
MYSYVMKSRNWPSGSMACARKKLNSSTSLLVVPAWIKPGEMEPDDCRQEAKHSTAHR